MKKFITNNTTSLSLGIIFVFVLWFLITTLIGQGNFLFPGPIDTIKEIGLLLTKAYTYQSIGWTLLRTLIGFVVSFIIALILGILSGSFPWVNTFLKPLMTTLKSVPTAALVFILLSLSNSRYAAIYIVILLAMPILYEAVVGGLMSIPQEINDSLKVDSRRFMSSLFQVRLPLSLPYIIVGLASSFALSLKTEIMAEIITGDTNYGLGCMISAYRSDDPTDLTPIFAIALIAIILVTIVSIGASLIKKKLSPKE